jgi:hypothetical protein
MRLRFVGPEPRDSWITFLLREGYTLDSVGARLGRLPAADIAPVGVGLVSRLWHAATAAAKRGGARVVERRRQEALRHIRRVRAQCGYSDASLRADIARF